MSENTKMKFNVLAIICIIVFCFAIAPKTLQNDTYYTIRTGEHIVENRAIDGEDHFAWTDLKYTYPHWAYDVFLYSIYHIGGMTGIYLSTAILSCILGVILYLTNIKINRTALSCFFSDTRNDVSSSRFYCSTCTACYIYLFCLRNSFH